MVLIVDAELISRSVTNDEFIALYQMVGGWYAFFFRDRKDGFEYAVKAILDVIGYNVDVVTLEKESLFNKIKKIIEMTRMGIPHKEENGITKDNFILNNDFNKYYINSNI